MCAMWCTWAALWLAGGALWGGPGGCAAAPPFTLPRAPPRPWRDPEQSEPPSPVLFFLTNVPLYCPKGQLLAGRRCVEVVTVNETEHEQALLKHLNASFPEDQVNYDYGDGALQLTNLNY